jgi:hypothetical protein
VSDILARCKTVCDNFHRHGPKRWRSEQLLLKEVESEWLRQFFIQGEEHKRLLWGYWKTPIVQLFRYWEQLERRTQQVLLLLRHASEERCGISSSVSTGKEALATIEQVHGDRSPQEAIYDNMASVLLERSKSRDLWAQRERDPAFKRMQPNCHPIPFPVVYGSSPSKPNEDDDDESLGRSPLPSGSSHFLAELASQV